MAGIGTVKAYPIVAQTWRGLDISIENSLQKKKSVSLSIKMFLIS